MSVVKMLAVGDISLETRDDKHPFRNIKQVFESKDILFGNLEVVLSIQGKKAKKAVLLYSHPQKVKYLNDVNFDVLNIANNHILDMGIEGFKNTITTLKESNLIFIGAESIYSASGYVIRQSKGIKFGFLGYTTGYFLRRSIPVNRVNEKQILTDISALKSKCDFVIISLHWGVENVFYPSPEQVELAHKLIDHGATLILGHHPHVPQGIEEYKNGLIAYSLGNFQFDINKSQSKTSNSIILCVNFNKDSLIGYNVIPIVIDADFLPSTVEDEEEDKILNFITEISQPIVDKGITNRWWFEQIAYEYMSGNLRSCATRIRKYGIRPLLESVLWLITPFCIRCYMAIIRTICRKHFWRGKR